ncbi:hypothetical protein NHH03_19800 [Stieleria sp. TO1_6]|nr:hypothetical protein [Stieleria tagensis]
MPSPAGADGRSLAALETRPFIMLQLTRRRCIGTGFDPWRVICTPTNRLAMLT